MPEDAPDRWFRKAILLALFLVWSILVLDLTGAEPDPPLMYGLTGVLFLIIGRMWDVELEEIDLPGISIGTSDRDDQD
ncbi:hypothetical protein RBH26_20645 [Natronolimnohabitans sp. A-GB9]|uniref:hypothetical protein n=1 Tax=Natronolimnohabitans sp. A-GB9 TaxID=3069757 RepID=UPI0027B43899|nr:hypothetical protein [Natronolimnohabitans sp. A-GB9]MDQ2052854.1 hypothetical protein [Natronolimnohabitans sp. A-GB9]